MLLEPSNKWYWQYDNAGQPVIIQLSDGLAMSCHLDKRNMNTLCKGRINFCAEDSSYYYYFLEAINGLHLSVAEKVQVALNAVTNLRFHKIKMPQSWFFDYKHSSCVFKTGDLVTLSAQGGDSDYIVLESDERVSTCMLLHSDIQLSESKVLCKFDVIRVMNDRVSLKQKIISDSTEADFPYFQIIA